MSTLTSEISRRGWAARAVIVLTVLALIATTLVVVPAFGTHGIPHPSFSGLPNEGVLRLHLGADPDQFEYQEWDGTHYVDTSPSASTQAIGAPVRCELVSIEADEAGDLATIASDGGTADGTEVGLVDDHAGLRARGSRGTPCGRVDLSEGAIAIALAEGTTASPSPVKDKEIDYAEIDIEGKHDVVVMAQFFLGGVSLGDPQEALDCSTDPDCGPDNAGQDNSRVVVAVAGQPADDGSADVVAPGVFDEIRLSVGDPLDDGGGEFSVGGGADGTERGPLGVFIGTDDSLFHITDVTGVTCGATTPTALGGPTTGAPFGTFLLANCSGVKPILFQTNVSGNSVTITNAGPAIAGSYTLETWTFLPVPPTAVLSYDDGDGEFDGEFCLRDPRNSSGTLDSGINTATVLPLNTAPSSPTRHTTCIIHEARTVVDPVSGATRIRAFFILFSNGDAIRRFR